MAERHVVDETVENAFAHACRVWDAGDLPQAAQLFLQLAQAGDVSGMLNYAAVAQTLGAINADEAISWFRKAWQCGDVTGALNMGIVWRQRKERRKAKRWFARAFHAGEGEAGLEWARLLAGKSRRAARVIARRSLTLETSLSGEGEEALVALLDEWG